MNKHGINSFFKSNVISSVGSLNSVVRNINAINLSGYYSEQINITFEDEKYDHYQFSFKSKNDELRYINIIENQGRHVQVQNNGSIKLIKEGLFPEGMPFKRTYEYNSIVDYLIRADYLALQLCSASSSYGGSVIC